jgi:hypothetical protein
MTGCWYGLWNGECSCICPMGMLGDPAAPRMDPEALGGVLAWDDGWDAAAPRMDPEALGGVLAWDDGWDVLGGVLGGLVAVWMGAVGRTAACGLDGDAGACILPWEGQPKAKEVSTPPPSCLTGGVGAAEAEEVSFFSEVGGGAEAKDSDSAALFWPLLPPPLPDPEGLPVEEEELEGLSIMGVPDMRSQMLMAPAQRGEGGTAGSKCFTMNSTLVK